jgi:GNAT superfamily N-acetyltransferase
MSKPEWTIRRARPQDGRPVRRFVFDILNEYRVPADPDDDDADVMEFGEPADERVVHLVAEVGGVGLGREMLARSEAEAKQHGYRRIFLRTRERYAEAVRLYERVGWTRGPDQPPPGPDRLYYRDL